MKVFSDASWIADFTVGASKIGLTVVSMTAASRIQLSEQMFGLPLPVLLMALLGALLSLLFMERLEGVQRRFAPLTILTFALIGAALAEVLPQISFFKTIIGNAPHPMLGLIFGFLGHRLVPLLRSDAYEAVKGFVKNVFAKKEKPDV